jgi:hypothetical protein
MADEVCAGGAGRGEDEGGQCGDTHTRALCAWCAGGADAA